MWGDFVIQKPLVYQVLLAKVYSRASKSSINTSLWNDSWVVADMGVKGVGAAKKLETKSRSSEE